MEGRVHFGTTCTLLNLSFLLLKNCLETGDIFWTGASSGQGSDGWIEEHSQFENILKREVLEVVDEPFCRAISNKSTGAEPALDEGLQFHYAQCFTESSTAYLQAFCEFSLRRKTVAG